MSKEIDELIAKIKDEVTAKVSNSIAVEAAVDAYLNFGLAPDKIIDKMITKYGLSREEAAIAVSEGKKRIDPFYSKSNIRYLEGIVKDVKDGTAHFSEHDLIEE